MTLTSAACPLTDVIEDQTRGRPRGHRHRLPDQLGVDAAVGPRQDHRWTAASSCAPSASTSERPGRHAHVRPGRRGRRPSASTLAGARSRRTTPAPSPLSRWCRSTGSTTTGSRSSSCAGAGMPWAGASAASSSPTRSAAGTCSRARQPVAGPSSVSPGAAATRPTRWSGPWPTRRPGSWRPRTPSGLVVGGDRTLVADVIADPRLAVLRGLPRRELYDLRDPTWRSCARPSPGGARSGSRWRRLRPDRRVSRRVGAPDRAPGPCRGFGAADT